MELPRDLQAAFEREIAEHTIIASQTLFIIGLVLFPIFIIVDAVLYPQLLWQLVRIRLAILPVLMLGLLTLQLCKRRGIAERFSRLFACAVLYPAVFSLDVLILVAGGAESPYYAGLCLVIIALHVTLPWPFWEQAAHSGFICSQYFLCMLLFDDKVESISAFIGNNFFMASMAAIGGVWAFTGHRLRLEEFKNRVALAKEKERADNLLKNTLPVTVADELKRSGRVEAREIPACTIMFTDFVGFTDITARTAPAELVRTLDKLFAGFDQIVARHGLEKLKTIGDSYMCAAGLPSPRSTHLVDCVLAALEILDFLDAWRREHADPADAQWQVRIGIHSGPVTAGVVGTVRFAYDVWGDTVNTAARLESASEVGRINVTSDSYRLIAHLFRGQDRGYLPVKGKGTLAMTFVHGLRPEYAADAQGRKPNESFWESYHRVRTERISLSPVERAPAPWSWFDKEGPMGDVLRRLIHLQEQDKEEIRRRSTLEPFTARQELVSQGARLDALLIVAEGHVGVKVAAEGGGEADAHRSQVDVSILGPGDLIGEMSFVSEEPASATVISIEAGRLLRVPRAVLDELMRFDPGFGARLFKSLSVLLATRLRETTGRLPAFMLEEVAHVKLHHTPLTGHLPEDAVPPVLRGVVERFKQGMLEQDRQLAREDSRRYRIRQQGTMKVPQSDEREAAYEQVAELCDNLVQVLSDLVSGTEHLPLREGLGAYTLRETFAHFMKSRLCDHCFSKPRGYAGDYTTIELIYQEQPGGDGRLGPLIDRWLLQRPSARAVRARRALMRDLLLSRTAAPRAEVYRVLALGAGSARELFDLFEQRAPGTVVATCLDIDVDALSFGAQLARERGLSERFLWAKENALMLGRQRGGGTRPAPQDMIYSVGLFDYLRDGVAVQVLNWIHDTLAPGGLAVVGNFDVRCPDRALLDHLLDWRLLYRRPEELIALLRRSAFGECAMELKWEDTHINHFVLARKPG